MIVRIRFGVFYRIRLIGSSAIKYLKESTYVFPVRKCDKTVTVSELK